MPQDLHFYAPQNDERANQPPMGMIAINEPILEARLRFLLHPAISHLLVAWRQSVTQITPNGWSYILATMTVLGQVGLFWLSNLAVMNYLVVPISRREVAMSFGYGEVGSWYLGSPTRSKGGTRTGGGPVGLGRL